MKSALIVCKSGVMFSGKLLSEYSGELDWVGIKPSERSQVCMYFDKKRMKEIIFEDGRKEILVESDLRVKPEMDLGMADENLILVRIQGGVSYRGENLTELPEGIEWREGRWISPSKIRETIIYVPNEEIEKEYVMCE